MAKSPSNYHDSRESWLRAATNELRPYFEGCDYPLPDKIRFAIGFPSTGRKGSRVGECWHSSTSNDEHFEIFIRADIDDPAEVLGVLVHELVHAVIPIDAKHGKLYRAAAVKLGLQGKMAHAMPGILLTKRLDELAANLGPLPHARLNIERGADNRGPADREKKQGTRMLKAECDIDGHGYVVRVAATHVRNDGPPICPRHKQPMTVDLPADEAAEQPAQEEKPETSPRRARSRRRTETAEQPGEQSADGERQEAV
ncbi:MAG: transcription elongation protein SprT [Acidobacteria bacterium]|nr:transcription elongation protein SprT [Acidobacteriota bacterium]